MTASIPVRRLSVALACAAAACLLTAPAGQAKIVVGKSVAGVKLGMTKKKVRKALGKPDEVSKINAGAWNYTKPKLRVGFRKGRVNVLLTWDRKQKTGKGIGMGSTVEQVQAAYPDADCVLDPNVAPYIPICFIAKRYRGKKSETYFRFDTPDGKVTEMSTHFGSMQG
jgi:outer membrane protein assembly factor BamE (lipoprotein component of BamABCDE complex)